MYLPFLIAVLGSTISCVLGFAVYRILHQYEVVDLPNQRSSHVRPTIRGGGIAIIVTLVILGIFLNWREGARDVISIGLCLLGLAIVSFIDDMRSIRVSIRLASHMIAAVIGLTSLGVFSIETGFSYGSNSLVPIFGSSVLACLWVVGYTNAFNFMDGINGIAGVQAAVTGVGMALLSGLALGDFTATPILLSLAVAGAAVGFLPHNFPNARMFMGDVGSAPLGFLLGILVIWLSVTVGFWLIIPLALLHANYVLDTTVTLIRRIVRGERWHTAHREHFYQRLVRSGKSHSFVTSCESGLQLVVLTLMLLYVEAELAVRIGLVGVVLLIWLSFFAYCEYSFRMHTRRNGDGLKGSV